MRSTVPAGRRTLKSWKSSSRVLGIRCLPFVAGGGLTDEPLQHHRRRVHEFGVAWLGGNGPARAHGVADPLDDAQRLLLKAFEELDLTKRDEGSFQRRWLCNLRRVEVRRRNERSLPQETPSELGASFRHRERAQVEARINFTPVRLRNPHDGVAPGLRAREEHDDRLVSVAEVLAVVGLGTCDVNGTEKESAVAADLCFRGGLVLRVADGGGARLELDQVTALADQVLQHRIRLQAAIGDMVWRLGYVLTEGELEVLGRDPAERPGNAREVVRRSAALR